MYPGFKKEVLYYPSLDSTNTKARECISQGALTGTTIVAEQQTSGRGRGVNTWHSPQGGLYFSTLLMPPDLVRVPELSLVAGVAVVQALRTLIPDSLFMGLKWPNDILLENKKVAGILCESSGEENGMCIVGVGVNINTSKQELESYNRNAFPATSLSIECEGQSWDVRVVLALVLEHLEEVYQEYWHHGLEPILRLWHENSFMVGKKIRVHYGSNIEEGRFVGLDSRGAIVVENALGMKNRFFSGEVTCYWP